MDSNYNIKGKYGCWWEGGTGVSPEGNQCGECYPQWEDICPYLKKHKEIEELIDIINDVDDNGYAYDEDGYEITGYANSRKIAEALYNADYRKQSEGEWIKDEESKFEHRYRCSVCNFYLIGEQTKYCEECGAKMFVRMTHTCPHNIPNLIPTIEELLKGGAE